MGSKPERKKECRMRKSVKLPKGFYLIVLDQDRNEFSVEGPTDDDAGWNSRVCKAQDAGRHVRCSTALNPTRESAAANWQQRFGGKLVPPGSIV
jgi:hypothetical protein